MAVQPMVSNAQTLCYDESRSPSWVGMSRCNLPRENSCLNQPNFPSSVGWNTWLVGRAWSGFQESSGKRFF